MPSFCPLSLISSQGIRYRYRRRGQQNDHPPQSRCPRRLRLLRRRFGSCPTRSLQLLPAAARTAKRRPWLSRLARWDRRSQAADDPATAILQRQHHGWHGRRYSSTGKQERAHSHPDLPSYPHELPPVRPPSQQHPSQSSPSSADQGQFSESRCRANFLRHNRRCALRRRSETWSHY